MMCQSILLYVCNLSSKSLLYSDMRYPRYLKSVTCSIILSFITIFTLCMWFPHIAIDFVFVLHMVILYFLAISNNKKKVQLVSSLKHCSCRKFQAFWNVMSRRRVNSYHHFDRLELLHRLCQQSKNYLTLKFDFENKDTTFLRHVGNCLPADST